MRLNKAQLIGLFTIVVVLALYAVITFLKDENLFNGKSTYYIIYKDVDGLTTSSPVYIKGFKVGSILDIEFDNKSGLFTVLIKVKSSFEIPSNSVATIAGSGILGGKQINLALGDSKERAVLRVMMPAASSGIMSSVVLGIGRSIGETMAVVMVAGNQPRIPSSLLEGARTMTANIVLEMGYAADLHREALLATGAVLFVFILLINLSFSLIRRKKK